MSPLLFLSSKQMVLQFLALAMTALYGGWTLLKEALYSCFSCTLSLSTWSVSHIPYKRKAVAFINHLYTAGTEFMQI